ncbi:cellulose synthase like [Rhynchospora pubera]|uniref:glucomannan 4-beta-mannosyltransferase n=1 Tax=Rhynchospora pubera TaxID=906938 RepID=A0AAV8CW87_9POAL|nr:cellulose synthase like [Rhynchospora pubera]
MALFLDQPSCASITSKSAFKILTHSLPDSVSYKSHRVPIDSLFSNDQKHGSIRSIPRPSFSIGWWHCLVCGPRFPEFFLWLKNYRIDVKDVVPSHILDFGQGCDNLIIGDQLPLYTSNLFHLRRLQREFPTTIKWENVSKSVFYPLKLLRSIVMVPLLLFVLAVCLAKTLMILIEKLFVGAVYKLSIGAACRLEWPSDRVIIQVLDDSTDLVLKDLVELECQRWKSKGLNIKHEVRNNREGYKAGALKDGMKQDYVQDCEYIAMFDADFQPEPDFLLRTVPFLIHNPDIALVQSRWRFVNADECLMTRLQEMSLNYHFKIEQQAGSTMFGFFNFNGTAGVWRVTAISDAGGWKDRTTVEDMDLAVRASLRGWKFVYVDDVHVKSELPSTFKAFRFQQHRWSCGPANLFKKMFSEIVQNSKVSIWKKLHIICDFFFIGKIASPTVTFIYYCGVIPLSVFFPEVVIPYWGVVYVPTVITLCKSVGTPSSFHLVFVWILFENVMSLHQLKAALTGLFEAGRVNEWVVTEKLGEAHKTKPVVIDKIEAEKLVDSQLTKTCIPNIKKKKAGPSDRFYYSELAIGVFLLFGGYYDAAISKKGYSLYLVVQSLAFFVAGFGYIGTQSPNY